MKKLIMNDTIRSVKTNAILNAVRQSSALLFSLITFPYVSRMLGNVEYGRYSFASSITNYFFLLSGFGISNYAVREGARFREDRQKISNLVSDLFGFNLITFAISIILLEILVLNNSRIKSCASLILIQSLGIFLTTIGIDWVNIIFEDFFYITIRYVIIQVISFAMLLFFIRGPQDTWKYCVILVFASYGGNIINLTYIKRYVTVKVHFPIHFQKYLLPTAILFGNSLATMIYVNSDITMLGFFGSDSVVGIYGFASKIYNIIKQFINGVVVVAVPRLAHIKEKNAVQYNNYIIRIFQILILIVFPVMIGFYIFSDYVLNIIGGAGYVSGSRSFQILLMALIFALPASVYTNCILVINRMEKYCLIATVISAITNIGLNYILIPQYGAVGAAVTTVVAEMLNLFLQLEVAKKTLGISLKKVRRNFFTILIGSSGVAVICCCVRRITIMGNSAMVEFGKILIAFIISAPFYFTILFFTRNELICDAIEILKNGRK